MHGRGVVHGDISPTNILVKRQLASVVINHSLPPCSLASPPTIHSYLIDLGSARSSPDGDPPEPLATLPFAPPEALDGLLDPRSDIFSLGKTIASLPREVLDPEMLLVLSRMTERRPNDRYQHAGELIHALVGAIHGSPPAHRLATRVFLESPPLVGRELEIARFRSALDSEHRSTRPSEPEHRVFLWGGESGIGKSRLLGELARLAAVSGWHVLNVQCKENVLDPLGPLADLGEAVYGEPRPVVQFGEVCDQLLNYPKRTSSSTRDRVSGITGTDHVHGLPDSHHYALHDLAHKIGARQAELKVAIFLMTCNGQIPRRSNSFDYSRPLGMLRLSLLLTALTSLRTMNWKPSPNISRPDQMPTQVSCPGSPVSS